MSKFAHSGGLVYRGDASRVAKAPGLRRLLFEYISVFMLDLGFVREHLDVVEEKLRHRGMDPAQVLGNFREIDSDRRRHIGD